MKRDRKKRLIFYRGKGVIECIFQSFLCGILATLAVEGTLFYIALLLSDKGEEKKGE